MTLKERIGILRGVAIYYWKPFNKRRLMRFYSEFINEGSLCFDIGAHLGNRTNAWDSLGAKVVAVEPQPQCIAYLQKKFGKKKNITLVPKAVGATAGKATMHISPMNPAVSTLSDENWRKIIDEDSTFKVHWDKKMGVDIITLEQLIKEFGTPEFCKLDVENFEVEALQGLSTPIAAISVEFYPGTTSKAIDCIELLENLATYEYNWSYGESQVFNEEKWISSKEIKAIFRNYKRDFPYGDFYAKIKQSQPS